MTQVHHHLAALHKHLRQRKQVMHAQGSLSSMLNVVCHSHACSGRVSLVLTGVGSDDDWGAGMIADALYTFSNDITRVHSLLPELALADRRASTLTCVPNLLHAAQPMVCG